MVCQIQTQRARKQKEEENTHLHAHREVLCRNPEEMRYSGRKTPNLRRCGGYFFLEKLKNGLPEVCTWFAGTFLVLQVCLQVVFRGPFCLPNHRNVGHEISCLP